MLQMLYVSGAAPQMRHAEIEDILSASRRNNLHDGVTGMLLWAMASSFRSLRASRIRCAAFTDAFRPTTGIAI